MSASIFLKLEGVTGDSTKRDNEIDVISWSWDMSQPGTAHMGKGAGAGRVSVGDVQITKYVDGSTPMLMLMCCQGKHITEGQVTIERASGDAKPLEYMVLKMKNIFITNVSPSVSDGDATGMEAISLNFESFEVEVKAQTETGGGGGVAKAKFNMATNKA